MRLNLVVRTIFAVALAAAFLCRAGTLAQAQYYTGSGWTLTGYGYGLTTGSPGAAGYYSTSPYAYAYQGQLGTVAHADASYTQTFSTTYPGITGAYVHWTWSIVGTLGFFDNPTDPYYASTAGGLSNFGPADYSTSSHPTDNRSGTSFDITTSVSADVTNYGHSSGTVSVTVEGH